MSETAATETIPLDPQAKEFVQHLIEDVAHQRVPDLFSAQRPDVLCRIANRNGVTVLGARTSSFKDSELVDLMRYRLAQYLAVGFIDPQMVYQARMEYEPINNLSPNDIHFIAGAAETGEILCYAALKAPPPTPPGTTLRQKERPLMPAEKIHGWGVFNRLRILPDLPVSKIRELGRFVKNQRLHTLDELGARAPVELVAAAFRTLIGPLRLEVEAIVGDLEEGVALQNFRFFHLPMVVIHGTVPYEGETSYFFPRYQFCTVFPFAALMADFEGPLMTRLEAIEAALEKPGKRALLELFALKKQTAMPRSNLEPEGGMPPISATPMPQKGVAMQARRDILDQGERLRKTDLFGWLSVSEAATLGTFMVRTQAQPGQVIVHQGEQSDDLYLIESGEARVEAADRSGQRLQVARLGPGDYFGEIALLTGGERTADVVAVTAMDLLRLTKDAYTRYLSHAVEVEQRMARTAMQRTRETTRKIMSGNP